MIRSWVLLCLVACSSAEPDGREDDADAVPCEPEPCWDQVYSHLDCLLNPRSTQGRDCRRLNATEICKVFEDALRCSSEVGDSGCAFKSGRESFDSWIRGMEAVNTKLCFEGMMDNIVAYAQCWDVLRFGNCVQHFVGRVRHVADLAHLLADEPGGAGDLQPQREQCHLAMLRIAKCASIAARQEPADQGPTLCARAPVVDHVTEVLAAYFSVSECGVGVGGVVGHGAVCPPPPAPEQTEAARSETESATAPPRPEPAARGRDDLGVAADSDAPSQQHPAACASTSSSAASTPALAALAAVVSSALAAIKSA